MLLSAGFPSLLIISWSLHLGKVCPTIHTPLTFTDLHEANGTVLGSRSGTWKDKHYQLRLSLQIQVRNLLLVYFYFFGMFLMSKLKFTIKGVTNPKGRETEFAFGLQINWNILNSNQSTSKTSSCYWLQVVKVEEFKRKLFHWWQQRKVITTMYNFLLGARHCTQNTQNYDTEDFQTNTLMSQENVVNTVSA